MNNGRNSDKELEKRIKVLETRIRHLENELKLTKQESEQSVKNYYDLYTNMEAQVRERTKEYRKLQERMARAEKMEALGLLAGGVAHDGNNILAGIVGYLELIQAELSANHAVMEYVHGALGASKQMAAMINDLLAITRGGLEQKTPLNLNHVVEEFLVSPVAMELKKAHPGVELETDLDEGLLNIKGDMYALNKVIMNLVSNAMDACKENGLVEIGTTNEYIEGGINATGAKVREGEYVVLTVRDNGTGISKEDQSRIFEPFFTKKTLKRQGTGLGMTLVYQTVTDHGGTIELDSALNAGTTFYLYFPATREELMDQPGENEQSVEDLKGSGETIVVVDDVETQRTILTNILGKLGYRVLPMARGEDAVKYFEQDGADLVILDMIMDPGIDGLETYRRILKACPGQKAVITSGFAETERVKEAMRLGAGQFVKKPYSLVRIGRAVKVELSKT